jgi:plasmid stabilization system protein ParE
MHISKIELARKLGIDEKEVRRMLDTGHGTKLPRIPGTRELVVHPNYLVIYRVAASAIEIINVLHARQQYPVYR